VAGRVSPDFKVVGVVNVTPDSFSDGGLFLDPGKAVLHGIQLADEGAAILDVGGESTRPGAEPVDADEELRRVLPVFEALAPARPTARLSVDTSKAVVAQEAISRGATLVNDVTALRGDPRMVEVVAEAGVECCLMHMLGEPRTMQDDPRYDDVVSAVKAFLSERLQFAVANGIDESKVIVDPGIGFGKTLEHNLELVRRLDELVALGRPVMVGASRKSFLGRITGREDPAERVSGTVAINVLAYERGARLFRVHDVAPCFDSLAVAAATVSRPWTARTIRTSSTT
jgi:dihydropteroate synthase